MTTTKIETPELGEALGVYGSGGTSHVRNLLARATAAGVTDTATDEVVRKMRRHHQVASCLLVQSLPLVRADWSIECEDEPIAETLSTAYDSIAFDVHRTMSRALWAGRSPNTLTWDYRDDLKGIYPVEVRDLEPRTCHPILDDNGSLVGFVQRPKGIASAGDDVVVDTRDDGPVSLWIVEGLESGNYNGRPIVDSAVAPWQDSVAFRAFHARYLERFGEPVVIARAPSGQTIANAAEINAAVAAGETPPNPVLVDNLDTALTLGENLRHHSVIALPSSLLFGADGKPTGFAWNLEFLESKGGGGTDFVDALNLCDRKIARAMFVPDLLSQNDGETGSNALGQTHKTVWTETVEGRLDDYSRQITDQLIEPMRRINFGDRSPRARLVFRPLADEERERDWQLVTALVENGTLPIDGRQLAEKYDLPVLDDVTPPPAAVEARHKTPDASLSTAVEPARTRGRGGVRFAQVDPVAELSARRAEIRASLGLPVTPTPATVEARRAPDIRVYRGGVRVFAAVDPVAGLPEWKLPQAYDPPPWRRDLNARERRVGFARIERGMNAAEAEAIGKLSEILDQSHDAILRQLTAVIRKGTPAEVLAALGTLEITAGPKVARLWADLMAEVGGIALTELRTELADYAEKIPAAPGPEARALFTAYASTNAERTVAQVVTETRLELLNAYTSGVTSRTGLASIVASVFEAYQGAEGKPARLTTRMLSAKALNYQRAAAVERAGIPLAGAQYSAVLDRRTCGLCEKLDESVIPIESTDLSRFTPPVHHNCRCVWVWITRAEADFTPTWETPSASDVDRYGGLVI